jgi:hypothetical protein
VNGSILVGVIIALMFLASFTEWFYHVILGVNETVIKDIFFNYRIGVWIAMGVSFFVGMFWLLSMTQECPLVDQEKVGIFKYMNCDVYWQARSLFEGKPVSLLLKEAADKLAEPDNQSKNNSF